MTKLSAPLRHPNFRWLVAGRTFGEFGTVVAPFALAFAVIDLTGSAVDIGIVVGARSVASILLLLFGGVLADRFPRSVILQGTELAATLTQATIAASVLCGFASIPLLVVLSVVNGAVSAISGPASVSTTPLTVPATLLTQANAVGRLLWNTGRIAGAGIAGIMVTALGPGWALAGNSLLFLLSALSYRRIRLDRRERVPGSRPLAELAEGWHEFRARTWVWVVVIQFMVVNAVLVGGIAVLGPFVADSTFGRSGWGFALAAQTVGSLFGGILVARWQPRYALRLGVAVIVIEAVPIALLGQAPLLPLLVAAMFVAGVTIEQFVVAWDVSMQENIPEDKLARVYSYDMLGSYVALPVGQIAAGPLAEHFGLRTTLLGGAALIVVATCLALCSTDVRRLARKTYPATAQL